MTRRLSTLAILFALAIPAASVFAQHGAPAHGGGEGTTDPHEPLTDAEAEDEMAHGGGHGGHGLSFDALLHGEHATELYGSIVNFLILCLVFGWVIKNKVNPSLLAKREEMQEAMAEAARLKEEAEAKQQEYQSRLDRLDDELETIRGDMIKAGEAERDRIVAEAEKKAARLRKDTEFVIAQRFKQLREDLTREAVDSAIQAAEGVLREKATPADQTRLADAYLARLGEVALESKTSQENQA